MGPGAFVGELAFAVRREGFVEVVGKAPVACELAHRMVVGDVVDAGVFSFDEEEAGAGGVADVDLI